MSEPCLLIGDIGGTNARFALADAARPAFTAPRTVSCADFSTSHAAMRAYLDEVGAPEPSVICLAAAGPVVGGAVDFTNSHWVLDPGELERDFRTPKIRVLNDFEAVAHALPLLQADDCLTIGSRQSALAGGDYTVCAVGPGTGLGAAGLMRRAGVSLPVVGETGHSGFAPETPRQLQLARALRARYERVSVERLVSGSGIGNIYWGLARVDGAPERDLAAADIFAAAIDKSDAIAVETVELFFTALGQIAGDLVLKLGAWDGVYLAGGIARRYPDALLASGFRQGFENKGRQRPLMERVPTQLITRTEPGLLGASACAFDLHGRAP